MYERNKLMMMMTMMMMMMMMSVARFQLWAYFDDLCFVEQTSAGVLGLHDRWNVCHAVTRSVEIRVTASSSTSTEDEKQRPSDRD